MDGQVQDEEAGSPTPAGVVRPQRQRTSIPSFLFISFMLFMLTSHNGDEFLARHQYQNALRSLTYQLTNYTAWMNGTESNFSLPSKDPSVDPFVSSFLDYTGELDPLLASYYPNITGFIHGDAKFYNITPLSLMNASASSWIPLAQDYFADTNMTDLSGRLGTWNWTASEKFGLSVDEKKTSTSEDILDNVVLAHGVIKLTDSNTLEELKLEFEGIHFVTNGSIYGFAEPAGRHIDIRELPSLVPEAYRNVTARIIQPELSARITKLRNLIDAGVIEEETPTGDSISRTTCSFTFYAQIDSVKVPENLMRELEDELQKPTGIWTITPPKLSLEGLLTSKECGMLYRVSNTEGLRSRTFFRRVTTYTGTAAIIYLILVVILNRQMAHSRTPAGISRVSRWTFLTQAIVDSASFAGYLTFAIIAQGRASLSLIAPAFLACILFVYEAQFSLLIHQIQLPEDSANSPSPPVPAPIRPTAANSNAPPPTGSNQAQLPTPAVQRTTNTSHLTFGDIMQHVRSDPQTRLWLSLFFSLIIIVRVILSPTLSLSFVSITYSSFWLPQIIRSVRRGRSSGLTVEYIVGTTVCRLYVMLYFLACPKNVLDIEPRPWAYLVALFVVMQAIVVMLQGYLGPAFFLPQRFAVVKIYDYHPPMPLPDPEMPDQSLGDCAICMDTIHVDPLSRRSKPTDERGNRKAGKGKSTSGGLLSAVGNASARMSYSLAPCHHLFHTECLERWLAIKNICPQCRRPLPPL